MCFSVVTKEFFLDTQGQDHIMDITANVGDIVEETGLTEGIVTVFVPGSTAAITTIEYEPGLQKDIPAALDIIAPKGKDYAHHKTWGDDNGRSHVLSALLGPSLTVPFSNKRLILGRWQQIVFMEFDTRPRRRTVICQVIGK